MASQPEREKKPGAVGGGPRLIRIRTSHHGTLRLRPLSLGDLRYVVGIEDLASREFTIKLLSHQLVSPSHSQEALGALRDRSLLRVAAVWGRASMDHFGGSTEGYGSLEAFRQQAIDAVADYQRRIIRPFEPLFEDVARTLEGLRRTALASRITSVVPMPWLSDSAGLLAGLRLREQILATHQMLSDIQRLSSATESLVRPVLDDVARLSEALQSTWKDIVGSARSFSRAIEVIKQETSRFQVPDVGYLFSQLPSPALLLKWSIELEAATKGLRECGFEFTEEMWTLPFLAELSATSPRTRQAAIVRKMTAKALDAQLVSPAEALFEQSRTLRSRRTALRSAISAHKRRDYYASIPVLFPLVEGMFTRLLVIRGLVTVRKGKTYVPDDRGGVRRELFGLTSKAKHAKAQGRVVSAVLADVLVHIFAPQRNPILHGTLAKYGRAKLSTQLLFMVYILAREIAAHEPRRDASH